MLLAILNKLQTEQHVIDYYHVYFTTQFAVYILSHSCIMKEKEHVVIIYHTIK